MSELLDPVTMVAKLLVAVNVLAPVIVCAVSTVAKLPAPPIDGIEVATPLPLSPKP